jgi:hypothetical protein
MLWARILLLAAMERVATFRALFGAFFLTAVRKEIVMDARNKLSKCLSALIAATSAVFFMAWMSAGIAEEIKVKLTGDQEVPPVKTSASGSGTIRINDDKTVSGSVQVTGMDAVAAHIHQGAAGQNGPVAVPFVKGKGNEWGPASGAKLTDAQYKAFKAGDLYVNVHSKEHKDGEIRGQLKP